jgi:hypothetical protein
MKYAATAIIVAALIAGGALLATPRSQRAFELVGATARLVAVALVPSNGASLRSAAREFVVLQMDVRHRIFTGPALPGGQLRVHTNRLTWWR